MNRLRISIATLALAAAACNSASSAEPPRDHPLIASDVVATVNGAPITDRDVRLRAKGNEGHKEARDAEPANRRLDGVLDTVIREEMAAQRAAELGLDRDPRYQDGLRLLEAQLAAYRRKGLSEMFWDRQIDQKAEATDAEAQAVFAKSEKQIRTQLHVKQILRKGRAAIDEVERDLASGKSFDAVASGLFPNLPPGTSPWDLGYLSWYKLPEPWRPVVYGLADGATSAVIAGPNERYWILQIVDRKDDPAADFASVKSQILTDLKRQKVEVAREAAAKDLEAQAKVARLRAPTPERARPTED